MNNHDAVVSKDEFGNDTLNMFTTKDRSKGIVENKGINHHNSLISKDDNIAGFNNRSQFISKVAIKPDKDTVKYNNAPKAELFAKRNSNKIVEELNKDNGFYSLRLKNKNEKGSTDDFGDK